MGAADVGVVLKVLEQVQLSDEEIALLRGVRQFRPTRPVRPSARRSCGKPVVPGLRQQPMPPLQPRQRFAALSLRRLPAQLQRPDGDTPRSFAAAR